MSLDYTRPRTRHEDVNELAASRGPQGPLRELDLHPPFRQPRHLRVYMDRTGIECGMMWRMMWDVITCFYFYHALIMATHFHDLV